MKNSFTTIKNKQTNKTKQQQIRNNVIATSSTKAQSEAKIKSVQSLSTTQQGKEKLSVRNLFKEIELFQSRS